jgi:hypothetical protein
MDSLQTRRPTTLDVLNPRHFRILCKLHEGSPPCFFRKCCGRLDKFLSGNPIFQVPTIPFLPKSHHHLHLPQPLLPPHTVLLTHSHSIRSPIDAEMNLYPKDFVQCYHMLILPHGPITHAQKYSPLTCSNASICGHVRFVQSAVRICVD